MRITSTDNKYVKEWLKLKLKKYRDQNGQFIVEGHHLVEEALKYNYAKEIISLNEFNSLLPIFYVNEKIMKKLTSLETIPNIMAICTKLKSNSLNEKLILLDKVQDPGNLGTIIRSATAFGFGVILGNSCVDLYNEKTIRATKGMLFQANISNQDLESYIPWLIENDYEVYTTTLIKSVNIKNIKPSKKIAVIIGNEGSGVNKTLEKLATKSLYIPMKESVESLNAAVAASIIMYELGEKDGMD